MQNFNFLIAEADKLFSSHTFGKTAHSTWFAAFFTAHQNNHGKIAQDSSILGNLGQFGSDAIRVRQKFFILVSSTFIEIWVISKNLLKIRNKS